MFISFLFFCWLFKIFSKIRFCALPDDIQSVKTYLQTTKYEQIVEKYFNYKTKDSIAEAVGFDVFMLLDGKELAGYVKFQRSKAYLAKSKKTFDFLSFYCFTITDQYKGKGLSNMLLEESIKYLKKRFNLSNDTIIALHLSPADEKMPLAAKIYYSYGFHKGLFIEYDPKEMLHSVERLFNESRDMLEVANKNEIPAGKGYFFLCHCLLKNFGKNKSTKRIDLKDTEKLFDILKKRKADVK